MDIPDLTFLAEDNDDEIDRVNAEFAKEMKEERTKNEIMEYFVNLIGKKYPNVSLAEGFKIYKREVEDFAK